MDGGNIQNNRVLKEKREGERGGCKNVNYVMKCNLNHQGIEKP